MEVQSVGVLHPLKFHIPGFPYVMFEILFLNLFNIESNLQPVYSTSGESEYIIKVSDTRSMKEIFGKWTTKQLDPSTNLIATLHSITINHKGSELIFEGSYMVKIGEE
jgi:hypothetical protein